MPILSAILISYRDLAVDQCREACWVSWIELLPLWAHARCVAPLHNLYLISASLKHDYKVWKNCMKALLYVAVLPCAYRGWVILNGLQDVCAREQPFHVKCWLCVNICW